MPDVVIDVRDVTRTYHVGDVDLQALQGVSVRVERGELKADPKHITELRLN